MTIYIKNLKMNDLEQYNKIRNQFINIKNTVKNTELLINNIHIGVKPESKNNQLTKKFFFNISKI